MNKLKTLRESRGLTQSQFAEYLKITVSAYQRYEYGSRKPSLCMAIRIADALGVQGYKEFKSLWQESNNGD